MSVVSEKVGGRRGKELIAPIVMEGGYAAIRRVQEARKKEILQVCACLCVLIPKCIFSPPIEAIFLTCYRVVMLRAICPICTALAPPE